MSKKLISGSFHFVQENSGKNAVTVIFRKGDEIIIKGLIVEGGDISFNPEKNELILKFRMLKGDILSIGDE